MGHSGLLLLWGVKCWLWPSWRVIADGPRSVFPDIPNIPAFPQIPEILELPEVPEMPDIPEIPVIPELLHRFWDQFSLFFEVASRERLDSQREEPNLCFYWQAQHFQGFADFAEKAKIDKNRRKIAPTMLCE